MSELITLVMAGGKGTRLWPLSTAECPKQYIAFDEKGSLLSQALKRNQKLSKPKNIKIVTTTDQVNEAKNHLIEGMNDNSFIIEPEGRNTAPCIFLSVVELAKQGVSDDTVVAVVPSDQIILNEPGYLETLKVAAQTAREFEHIVIVGIEPHCPHTGYGYIDYQKNDGKVFNVRSFKEKPDEKTAAKYLEAGHYFWNSGMFVASMKTFKEHFQTHCPSYMRNWDRLQKDSSVYQELDAISFDYAVMEKSDKVKVVKAEFVWNDLGSWQAFDEVYPDQENIVLKAKQSFLKDSKNNVISVEDKEIALVGVEGLVVVEHQGKILVMPKVRSQEVRDVVDFFKK